MHLQLLTDAIGQFEMMTKSRKITRLSVRDMASFKGFEQVRKLVHQERVLRNIRHNSKRIVETIGETYLKKRELNKSAYVCID